MYASIIVLKLKYIMKVRCRIL